MQIDLAYTASITGAQDSARQAAIDGFRGFWTSETKHDPFLTLSLATQAAPDLQVGTGIAVALARSPYTIAQSAWDLARISGNQFRLGLGSQVKAHITRRFSMPWHKPVAQMREMIAAIRAIWHSFETGERLKFQGEYYQHTLLIENFNPGPRKAPPIPIGLAAVGPKMSALAGEMADFVLLHPFTNLEFVESTTLPALGQGSQARDPSLGPLEVVGSLFAFPEGPKASENEEIVRRKVAFYASTPAYSGVLEAIDRGDLSSKFHQLSKKRQWDEMARLVDARMLEAFRVRAPKEELFEAIKERYGGVYDRVIVTVPGQ